jgi:PAS domain S-box-containing protein
MKASSAKSRKAPPARAKTAKAAGVADSVYRTLFESSPVPILLEDAAGTILDLNAAACQVFGYARAELLGQNILKMVPPADHPRVGRNLADLLAGHVLVHEVWGLRKDGTLCPVELHEQRITLPNGEPGVLALAHDITARKQAEETGNLRDSALKASANAIVVTDREGRIVWANPAFSRATGYSLKEAIGQNPRLVKSGHHDAEFYQQLWDTILAGRVWQGELINRRRDGSVYHEHTTITPVRDAKGKISHFIAVKQDISERNRLAEELRLSERFVRATLDALSAHIAILDEQGVILDVNQAWREFAHENRVVAGQLCEGAQYLAVYRQISGTGSAGGPEVAEGLQRVLQGRTEVYKFEFPCAWPGQPRWFVGRLTRFAGSGPARLVVAHEDVSERKHAEQALTLSGHQYRVLTETMKDVVWILDADRLRFRYVSPSVRLLRGFTAEEVMDEPASRAFTPGTAETFIRLLRARAEAFRAEQAPPEQFYVNEVEQPRKDGSTVWTEVVTSYHINPESGHIEVRGVSRDITDRAQARQAMQQAKEHFQALFLASPLPIIVLDREATVRLWSPAAEEMFGWSAAEVTGQPSPVIPEEHREELQQYLDRILAGETIRGSEPRPRQRKDGSQVDVLISAAPLHEMDGSVSGAILIYTDLTEKTRLEAQLLRAQRLESIGHLAGGIAHDLNNALTPILMGAPAIRPELTDPGAQEILDQIQMSALRGAQIVKQILVFARGGQVEMTAVQTRHLLRETSDAIRATFPKNITLKTQIPRDLWPVRGNVTQLHQVVMNLCLNARDAMPEGGTMTLTAQNFEVTPEFAKQFSHSHAGPHIVWTISDTGVGIAPEHLDRIFDPFFSTKAIGKGTGLGLATVYGIIRMHDGFLQVQSALGEGTRFKIYFPAAPTEEPEPELEPLPPAQGQGEVVLVVDDDESIRRVMGPLLQHHGYKVALAEDGHHGLAQAQALGSRLALVLTDLMMPRMNGLQLIRALRQAGLRPGIVAMTGLPDAAVLAELENLGVNHVLQKPCELTSLLATLRAVLDTNPGAPAAPPSPGPGRKR